MEGEAGEQDVPQSRRTRAATARTERLWEYAVIPYEIESNFSGMFSFPSNYIPTHHDM